MRFLPAATVAALVACSACSIGAHGALESRGPGASRLATIIAGKTAGRARSCVRREDTRDMVVIDEETIAFRSGSTVYVNRLGGHCSGLGGPYALVMRSTLGDACRGDIATIADLTSGTAVGSCTLGDFVPYAPRR